jgi:hypothetical protein
MNIRKLICAALASGLFGATSVWAGTSVDTGSLKVSFQEQGWVTSDELPFTQEIRDPPGSLHGKSRVLTLTGPGDSALAVVYIGMTDGQAGVRVPRQGCGYEQVHYVRDLNESKVEDIRCVYAGGPYEGTHMLGHFLPGLGNAFWTVKLVTPRTGYFASVLGTAKDGRVIQVEAMLASEFIGLPGRKPVAETPALLRVAVAAWADKLAEESIQALISNSGRLVIPPVQFSSTAK